MEVIVDEVKLKEYNDIPVKYCSRCLSLYILSANEIDYCDKCGSTTIEEAHIKEWEDKYKGKYGKTLLNK